MKKRKMVKQKNQLNGKIGSTEKSVKWKNWLNKNSVKQKKWLNRKKWLKRKIS